MAICYLDKGSVLKISNFTLIVTHNPKPMSYKRRIKQVFVCNAAPKSCNFIGIVASWLNKKQILDTPCAFTVLSHDVGTNSFVRGPGPTICKVDSKVREKLMKTFSCTLALSLQIYALIVLWEMKLKCEFCYYNHKSFVQDFLFCFSILWLVIWPSVKFAYLPLYMSYVISIFSNVLGVPTYYFSEKKYCGNVSE